MMGIETEYAFSAFDAEGKAMPRQDFIMRLMDTVCKNMPHLKECPDSNAAIFLANGARLYIDSGDHPEMTTPECLDPTDTVRFILAGERTLSRCANELAENSEGLDEVAFFRCNVDYSGAGTTWGCHESYMHSLPNEEMPDNIVPHLASRIVFTGAGGFNSHSPGIEFMVSPRVTHLSQEVSSNSQHDRGICHTKNESLSDGSSSRLHILCGESLSSHQSMWLKLGTTALVVAMTEGGLRPGDGVALTNAIGAMKVFASDTTCSKKVPMVNGISMSAIEIQRHYLDLALANVTRHFMPDWAPDVCLLWGQVLDNLSTDPETECASLDWAIKYKLYTDVLERAGFTWELAEQYKSFLIQPLTTRLRSVLNAAGSGELHITRDAIMVKGTPCAETLHTLDPLLRAQGLSWDQLHEFIDLRQKLFEIDTRFGQLGDRGIFNAMDKQDVLQHNVPGVENIEDAVHFPPKEGRARSRGDWVRRLSRLDGETYTCSWMNIANLNSGKWLDLRKPLETIAKWRGSTYDDNGDVPAFIARRAARYAQRRRRAEGS